MFSYKVNYWWFSLECHDDPSYRSAPTESNKWAFTSWSRCFAPFTSLTSSPLVPPSASLSISCSSSPNPLSGRSPHITCLYKRHNVANAFVTKGIRVKMHHLCFLTVKHNLAASTAGEPGRLMCMSHQLRSHPPEEKVSFLLWPETRQEVCLCVLHVLARFCIFTQFELKTVVYLIHRKKKK